MGKSPFGDFGGTVRVEMVKICNFLSGTKHIILVVYLILTLDIFDCFKDPVPINIIIMLKLTNKANKLSNRSTQVYICKVVNFMT